MNTSRPLIASGVLLLVLAAARALAVDPITPAPSSAPVVTMIVPGFTVRALSIDLTNLTSLEYSADGKLWALGYDGRIHILTDSKGGGLEDTAKTWWQPKDAKAFRGPIGMKVTKEGVYVASKGKISLIKDTDGNGTADTEEIIATGWKEAFTAVDATGLAIDKEGNIYFGLGCADFSNAYQLDKEKKPHYDINSTQGTIQRLSADHKKRETLATGVRFAIGIAFNRHGDLFWTDQEGDTWTHGNHLDELNVLLPGRRHYGFPERHPEYLPNTDDEGPVVGFGPQHQSTCGLKFNEAKPGWKIFGPKFWENDALIAGESRGKIWRVPLAKVREGYVGRPVLIGVTSMLTIDLAVSPKGDMVVCCHSGPPDWGTGPTGKGKLFKISYTDEAAPQPAIAWPAAKDEIRVAFDRPIDKSVEERMTGLTVSCGEYVRAADRLEVMRPPYVAVKAQMQTPRRELKIASAKLSDDGRTIAVKLAEPMPWRSGYAIAVPGVKAPGAAGLGMVVDVDFVMSGVEASVWGTEDYPRWTGWNPNLNPAVNLALAPDTGPIGLLLDRQPSRAGDTVRMTAAVDLPGKVAMLTLRCGRPFSAGLDKQPRREAEAFRNDAGTGYEVRLEAARGERLPVLSVTIVAGGPGNARWLDLTYHSDSSPTERPVPLDSLLPPWAPTDRQPVITTPTPPELTKGGDWSAGKALFFGEAKCSTCHTVRGEGGALGPNLSNLVHLNPESVLADILQPSARINPDYINFIVTTADDTISGLVRHEADQLIVMEGADKTTRLTREQIKEIRPSKISLMPEGYKDLGEAKLRDILTFLTSEPPKGK